MATDWRTTYIDVCNEIEIYEARRQELAYELDFVRRQLLRHSGPRDKLVANYDGMPKAQHVAQPFDKLWEKMREIETHITELNDVIDLKDELKRRLEYNMGQFQGIELRIASLMVRGKRLYEIADELGYTYDWIRKVAARMKRKKGTMKAQIS